LLIHLLTVLSQSIDPGRRLRHATRVARSGLVEGPKPAQAGGDPGRRKEPDSPLVL